MVGTFMAAAIVRPSVALTEIVLTGHHVRLEPLRLHHVDELWEHAQEHDVWRYMLWDVRSKRDLQSWIDARLAALRAGTALPFVQRDALTGACFGSTSLFDHEPAHRRIEIGHTWIGAAYRRTAINTEAKLLLLRHAFEALDANRVQFKCDVRNVRSQAAIERLGATREGVLRSWMLLPDGAGRDTCIFSILRGEWPQVRDRLSQMLQTPASA